MLWYNSFYSLHFYSVYCLLIIVVLFCFVLFVDVRLGQMLTPAPQGATKQHVILLEADNDLYIIYTA